MRFQVKTEDGEIAIPLDMRIYGREAVDLAAHVFAETAEFFLEDEGRDSIRVTLRPREKGSVEGLMKTAGDFLSELLSQDLRLGLARKNARVLRLVSVRALLSASESMDAPKPDPKREKEFQKETKRLMDEARPKVVSRGKGKGKGK